MVKVEQTRSCQMPECIVTLHGLWKLVRDGKVAVRDAAHGTDGGAGGTDRSSSCKTVSFYF